MKPRLIELPGPSQTIYLVADGVLDPRSTAAFMLGQCHGLALAISARMGWSLLALNSKTGTCTHVCVRRPDGWLVDVTGAHTKSDFEKSSPGSTLTTIDEFGIARLVDQESWAPPAVDAAQNFIDPVLARGKEPSEMPAGKGLTLRKSFDVGPVEVRCDWHGFSWMEVWVQPTGGGDDWSRYGPLQLPLDPERNAYLIEFSPEVFEQTACTWIESKFDLDRAKQSLA